jgi:hypothetical protein
MVGWSAREEGCCKTLVVTVEIYGKSMDILHGFLFEQNSRPQKFEIREWFALWLHLQINICFSVEISGYDFLTKSSGVFYEIVLSLK